ncbi:udp-n-acetylglucosamine transporter [Plasmopara halstedii]|uniref:Udp-n-acetylglucosamine transporter n=1 Tax=Plasmopara halstedii TaxID=4781 RepID=A0A0P1AA88_PLAHL|nr:udp-n-acetylglucosamine transporter [Plasmopara halstedii]CEG37693.1 udp-n-acetylglucosamine transporter [Plasmopara halstedii]|eukprot:XP_024574062.1 udp-n-acetylglucosamine transporter [Plasmopara halstedii]
MKHLSFIMLVLQNTALSIVSKYSRANNGPKYRPSTVVLLVELLKFVLCCFMLYKIKRGNLKATMLTLQIEVFADKKGLTKMTVLAFLYALQNMFALVAYDYVDVATYQIVYQLKIITTAMFMILLLQRRFSVVQWCAMVALMAGVAICSYSRLPSASQHSDEATSSKRFIGVCIMLGLAVNSGLAAAYFERVMKAHKGVQTQQTIDPLWVRNLQLSAISVLVTCFDLVRNFGQVWTSGFFYGFQPVVFAVIFLQAVGGLTIAAVVRYSDNIVKNFGTSFSLILSCIISNYMFDETAPLSFYFGVCLVVGSVFVYGDNRFALKPAAKKEHRSMSEDAANEIVIENKSMQVLHSGSRSFVARSVQTFNGLCV